MKPVYILIIILFSIQNFSFAQEFRGGDIYFERIDPSYGKIIVDIYYKADTTFNAPEIQLNISSISFPILNWTEKQVLTKGLLLFRYTTEHYFSNFNYHVSLVEPFELNSLINVNTPHYIWLSNYYDNAVFWSYTNEDLPYFHNLQDSYYLEDGIFYYPLMSSDSDPGHDVQFQFEWNLYNNIDTTINYSVPAASNSFSFDHETGLIVWDSPIEPGKFLFALEVVEILNQQFSIGKKIRYQVIEITKADIISSYKKASSDINETISIYPNPANDVIVINSDVPFRNCTINLYDINGKKIRTILLPDGLTAYSANVGDFNAGVYILIVENKSGQLLRKRIIVK